MQRRWSLKQKPVPLVIELSPDADEQAAKLAVEISLLQPPRALNHLRVQGVKAAKNRFERERHRAVHSEGVQHFRLLRLLQKGTFRLLNLALEDKCLIVRGELATIYEHGHEFLGVHQPEGQVKQIGLS